MLQKKVAAILIALVLGSVSAATTTANARGWHPLSQEWLIKFVEHRVGDRRIIRLIQKWLKAGVLEVGIVTVSDKGTGQGSVISPLLANLYLHYVFDLWAERWRRREAAGDMIIVRYADDLIVGFEHETDARRFLDGTVVGCRNQGPSFRLESEPPSVRSTAYRAPPPARTGKASFAFRS
jgi:RNA-directed DNA polymerase